MGKREPFSRPFSNTGEAQDSPRIRIPDRGSRVFSSTGQPLASRGTRRVIVTDEMDTNMVIYQQDIRL